MREVIKEAATVREAVDLALEELGLSLGDVSYEVLEEPRQVFIFKKPAKVLVRAREDEFDVKSLLLEAELNRPSEPRKEEKAPGREEKREEKKADKPAEKKEDRREEKREKSPEKPAKKARRPEGAREEKKAAEVEEAPESAEKAAPAEEILPEARSEKLAGAIEFVDGIVSRFNPGEYTLSAYRTEKGSVIRIEGEDVGSLIGRKGETMEAISYLAGLAANRISDDSEKVTVDIANYRRKREKDLVSSTKKAAAKVLRTGKPFSFEPMTPYDRRIVHSTAGEIEGIRSESKGEGSSRRVVLYSTAPRRKSSDRDPEKKSSSRRSGRDRNGRGDRNERRDRRPARSEDAGNRRTAPAKVKEDKLIDVPDFGLYSRIDLDD